MKANESKLLKFMRNASQFSIPIYQRNYSWTEPQCRKLYDDIFKAGKIETIQAHFIGSIVYISNGLSTITSQETLLVIDGQQRLTTCTLLIAALANYLEKNNIDEPIEGFSIDELREYYLINRLSKDERHYKLLLSDIDRETLKSLVKNKPFPSQISMRIEENYKLFFNWLEQDKENLKSICKGLDKLMIVDVALDRNQDNPQRIFESMNSTGLALSQADLVRNYILMGLDVESQKELYQDYWKKIEIMFGQEAYISHFNSFMRHYLTVKTNDIPNINHVYEEFKTFSVIQFKDNAKELMKDIYKYAEYYYAIALNQEKENKLKLAFNNLNALKVDVAYPLLLQLYESYNAGELLLSDFVTIVKLIESYVFRRAICSIPTNSLNKTFVSLGKELSLLLQKDLGEELNKNKAINIVNFCLIKMESYRRFPNDAEFQMQFMTRDVYNFSRCKYLLERLENYQRKEIVNTEEYTIEHILPKNEKISKEWQKELGVDYLSIYQKYVHTVGNLTLTAYNSEFSDRPFYYKAKEIRDKSGNDISLSVSPLHLNQDFKAVECWNEEAIKNRAFRLAKLATEIWKMPELTDTQRSCFEENLA